MSETTIIEHPENLVGERVHDQDGRSLGEIEDIYGIGENGVPMWITLEISTGIGRKRRVFVPVARLKQEDGELRVPYSSRHLETAPDYDIADEVSDEHERALRDFYAIDLADAEQRSDNISYAAQVPSEEGPARRLTDS
jgi:hypothetical protein